MGVMTTGDFGKGKNCFVKTDKKKHLHNKYINNIIIFQASKRQDYIINLSINVTRSTVMSI